VQALDGVDLEAFPGEVLGVIGPNGAGKTTLLESLVGLRVPDEGTVSVLGLDPRRERKRLLQLLSLQPQQAAVFQSLTVRETVALWCSFYQDPADPDELVDALDLTSKAGARIKSLSGGQLQRVRLALALAGRTPVVLLDEPTGALDPQARDLAWEVVRERATSGTVVLTTHSMDEAEALCDRVVIVDAGRVIAEGAPAELAARQGGGSITARARGEVSREVLASLPGVITATVQGGRTGGTVRLRTTDLDRTVAALRRVPALHLQDLRTRDASLHDVFLALTGRELREEEQ
jgi:ABC-2 type transport system ATP-binding protein